MTALFQPDPDCPHCKLIREYEERQDALIAGGSVLSDIGDCGKYQLPCGVCTECEEQE